MKKIKLGLKTDRPLAFFDIEATGINTRTDRIIELAVVKVLPDGNTEEFIWLVNPDMPIPPETTAIHGFTDQDVVDCPKFKDLAGEIDLAIKDCDLAGYNNIRFDVPMLLEEFTRAGIHFDIESRRIVDVQRIFHKKEPRDLTAALAFYCGEMHLGAHGAMPDVLATIRVLQGQYIRYHDLPESVEKLDDYCNPRDPSWADRQGRIRWSSGELVINFGRKKGSTIKSILKDDSGFINWMLKNDFPADTKQILQDATNGIWPPAPEENTSGDT